MAYQTWRVGLDIQNGQLCALGIQRRRNGWQLRHWWRHALPQDTLRNGLVQRPETLVPLLREWRKRLPRAISLRVGFPPQLVMQRRCPLPALSLRESERPDYIHAAATRCFPVSPRALALDYRVTAAPARQICLTATRQEALQNWLDCLGEASLVPQVLELSPAALCALAQSLPLNRHVTLVHRLLDHWLWFSTGDEEQPWGWCSSEEIRDFSALRQTKPRWEEVWYSSALEESPPDNTRALSPLNAIQFYQPPLPLNDGGFALAAGLALRPEDSAWFG